MISSILGFAYDCKDADALADFYVALLGWEKTLSGGGWAGIHSPQGIILAFQTVEEYTPPVWPWEDGQQQQMAHIDFKVEDLKAAVAHAIACGATLASAQYYDTSTVLLDPAGHPFCLSTVQQ
jgi:catechol 2,3-dioxygenase-like lactoylglutathione lyase family enzyme